MVDIRITDAKGRAKVYRGKLRAFAAEHPFTTIIISIVIGCIAGGVIF